MHNLKRKTKLNFIKKKEKRYKQKRNSKVGGTFAQTRGKKKRKKEEKKT